MLYSRSLLIYFIYRRCCSVTQSCLALCDPINCSTPGFPRPSPSPGACSNLCPLSWWCHPSICSSVILFCSCLQSFPPSGSSPVSRPLASGGQTVGGSTSVSLLPMNIQDWVPLGWTGWIPCNPRDSQESSPTPQFKHINSLALSFLYSPTLQIHIWLLEKLSLTFVSKVMSLLFNTLSRFVIAFLPRSRCF